MTCAREHTGAHVLCIAHARGEPSLQAVSLALRAVLVNFGRLAGMQFTADAVMVGTAKIKAGDIISIDGNTGEVFLGELRSRVDEDPYLEQLKAWVEDKQKD